MRLVTFARCGSSEEQFGVLLEDRPERAGVKFKDADLIGIPGQVVVGRLAGEGKVEVRRRGGDRRTVLVEDAATAVRELLSTNLPD